MANNSTISDRLRFTPRRVLRALLILFLALFAGLFLHHAYVHHGDGHPLATSLEGSVTSQDSSAPTLADLSRALESEARARHALALRLTRLEGLSTGANPNLAEDFAEREDEFESSLTAEESTAKTAQTSLNSDASRFNDGSLLSQGVDRREATRLKDLWNNYELERAALLDRSIREGWFFSDRRRAELNRLERDFRATLQDDEYDQVLYALGKPNRVRVGEVLNGSNASEAGLRRNDLLLSYDGNRIFKPLELLMRSSAGISGESVPIDIFRDDRVETLYISRGPLGILTEHDQGPPISP